MVANNPSSWLSFSLTPVQGFIAAARTVRDLKVGSALLSHLVRVAIKGAQTKGGGLLYPSVDPGVLNGPAEELHLPNRFLMSFTTENEAKEGAEAAKQAVLEEWEALSGAVHKLLGGLLKGNQFSGWDQQWDKQIEEFWEVQTMVLPASECTSAWAHDLVGADRGDWGRVWDIMSALQAMGKQVRHFREDHGIGRPKCTMMGDLEQMGPGGSLKKQGEFWEEATRHFRHRGVRVNERRDRLCAVSLVKRFAPVCSGKDALGGMTASIPDTAWIATADWREQSESELGDLYRAWHEAATKLAGLRGEEGETPGRYLLTHEVTAQAITKDSPNAEAGEVAAAESAMIGARKKLLREAGKKGIGGPPRYLAALALDGDKIGEWLSGRGVEGGELGPDRVKAISQCLRTYAKRSREIIEGNYHGLAIYAGGDDVLALLPVATALECAGELREKFRTIVKLEDGEGPTVSIGVAFFHYMHDLRDALRRAHQAADRAKDLGRDAFGWEVVRRSGNAVRGTLSWEALKTVIDIGEEFSAGASDRWAYRLATATADMDDPPGEPALKSVIKLYVRKGTEESKQSSLVTLAESLWNQISTFAQKRGGMVDSSLDSLVWKRNGFTDALGLASFLARRGGGDA